MNFNQTINSLIKKHYLKRNGLISKEDLKHQAWLIFQRAKKNYDPKKGSLKKFAYRWISYELRNYINKNKLFLSYSAKDSQDYFYDILQANRKRIPLEKQDNTGSFPIEELHFTRQVPEDIFYAKEIKTILKKALGKRSFMILQDKVIGVSINDMARKYGLKTEKTRRIAEVTYYKALKILKEHKRIYE